MASRSRRSASLRRPRAMTRQAYDLTIDGFGPGANGPLVIAAALPAPSARCKFDALARRLRGEQGVAFVRGPQISTDATAAIVTVTPTTSPQDAETEDLVNRLRDDVVPRERAAR